MPFPGISRAALFERLARGHAERLTVLTPNRRLARALEAEADASQLAGGHASWEAPDVLPFPAFVQRCHEEALYSGSGAGLPSLLTDLAARILWEEAIRASEWHEKVLSVAGTAALSADAWALAHQWRIEGALRDPSAGEDALAFAGWAEHYARRLARDNLIDSARLPQHAAELLASGAIERPTQVVAYAFDVLTPQQSDLLDACVRAGIAVAICNADAGEPGAEARRLVLDSPRAELEHAARWARARLEAAGEGTVPRIGIIVPDLQKRRQETVRIFARTLAPAMPPPGTGAAAPPFGLSLGLPLAAYPLVDAAIALLELASGPVAYDRASRLLRSPFVEGAETEAGDRARLDAALRRIVPAELNLLRLRQSVSQAVMRQGAPECPQFTRLIDRVIEATQDQGRAAPHDWARRFTRVLDAAGFPGERTLDSAEYQTLMKWGEALRDLAALGLVAPAWNGADARSRLQRLCTETIFQPETSEAPVQVLGLLESPGLAFDHLWVCGLTEDAWPLAARPHPLISPVLQRRAGIPQASPEAALDYDRRITEGWLRAAPEVVVSSARMDGERELLPSPLTMDVAITDPTQAGIPEFAELRRELLRARRGAIECIPDDRGPPIATPLVKGGARVLVDQAACPFRAFAHFRLDAHQLEHPEHGLGPLERGTLLHEMMGRVWEVLQDQATLKAKSDEELVKVTREAAHLAIERVRQDRPGRLDGHFAELEQERLALVALEWLALERQRPPFTVTLREEKVPLHAGDVQLEGRIDRMDVLEGGGRVVIDYKSGMVSVMSWLGPRPDDAQLPLYALALGHEEVDAVAFARMKTGQRAFVGLARDAGVNIKGVTPIQKHKGAGKISDTWSGLFTAWDGEVRALGENFAAGDAVVDPKELLLTCRRCDLKSLCRVHERLGALDEGEEEDSAPEETEP